MLKNYNEHVQTSIRLLDVLICVVAFFTALAIRFRDLGVADSVVWMLAASLSIHFLLYPALGFYQSLRLKSASQILAMILRAAVTEFFILGTLVFLLQAKTTSRIFFAFFLGANYTLILFEKLGGRLLLSQVRKRGYNFRQVLVVGMGENARRVVGLLREHRHWGYHVCGILSEEGVASAPARAAPPPEWDGVPVLGSLADLERVVGERAIDELFFAPDRIDASAVASSVALAERVGLTMRFSLSLFELPLSKFTFSRQGEIPVLTFYTTLKTPIEAFLKRAMDILISLAGLALTGLLYPWISWRIRRESPGPVIFKQMRVGENGRRFKCYKFRTMHLDAEARKAELQAANQMSGPLFKLSNDPRVFEFGKFLRRSSLDELPQFLNILRGDMSVVGTRPPTPDEVNRYEAHYRRRLSIRPGLTGLWQTSGRNEIHRFEDVLELDLKYIDHWSLWLDLKIVARTVWVAFTGRGAV